MRYKNSSFLFPLFALFVIFSDELFYSVTSILGISLESGMKGRLAIVIAGMSYVMMLGDLINKRFTKHNGRLFRTLFFILFLYVVTGFFYSDSGVNHYYIAQILVFGSLCIPATYIGMRLARRSYDDAMMRFLPYFLILVALLVGYAVISGFMEGRLLSRDNEDDFGLNYQNSSYYLAYCCVYSVFYAFFIGGDRKGFWDKMLYAAVIGLIFLCAVGTIVGGGRGAFVYLIIGIVFLVIRIMGKGVKKSNAKYFIMLAGAFAVMAYLSIHFNIFESTGALRVTNSLTVDDERSVLTRKVIKSFADSPIIGHGLGSVWWEVGFRSHNMVQDMLVEGGIIGTIILVVVLMKMLFRLLRRSKNNNFDLFVFLLFLSHFVQDNFSGYWFSSFCMFMIYGYVFGESKMKINLIK